MRHNDKQTKDYYILGKIDGKTYELAVIKCSDEQIVAYSRLHPALNIPSAHITYHGKRGEFKSSIIQITQDSSKEKILKTEKDDEDFYFFPSFMINLQKIDWSNHSEFEKTGHNFLEIDIDEYNKIPTICIYFGKQDKVKDITKNPSSYPQIISVWPTKDGFKTPSDGINQIFAAASGPVAEGSEINIGFTVIAPTEPLDHEVPKNPESLSGKFVAYGSDGKRKVNDL